MIFQKIDSSETIPAALINRIAIII